MKTKFVLSILCALSLLTTSACGSKSNGAASVSPSASKATTGTSASQTPAQQTFLTFKDSTGQDVTLKKKPERIVVLNTEALELFYQLGGKAIGRASAPGTPVPDAAKDVEEVGQINSVSLEKINALNPDLVIGQSFFHTNLKNSLTASGIPLALMKIETYDDVKQAGKLFGQLLGKSAETDKLLQETDQRVRVILDKVPAKTPSFAAITLMSMGISLQKSNTITLDIAGNLRLKNVAQGMTAGQLPDSVPYSVEKLIEADPDYIFLVVHGTEEEGKKLLKDKIENNPAWASLRAVKEKRMYFLPSEFVNTPGLKIDHSFEYLAKLAYPDVYGK